jgi:hypothetical protein
MDRGSQHPVSSGTDLRSWCWTATAASAMSPRSWDRSRQVAHLGQCRAAGLGRPIFCTLW